MLKPLLVMLLSLSLSLNMQGCAAPQQTLKTSSGQPEVTVSNVTKKQILDMVVADALGRGSEVRGVSEYGVTIVRRADPASMAGFMFSSRAGGPPEWRFQINTVETQGAVKIYARSTLTENPGTAFEKSNDTTDSMSNDLQSILEDIKRRLAK